MKTVARLHRSGIAVGPERTIADVARVMESSGVGSVAVIDGDDLVGIVTDRDIVRRGIARGLRNDARIDSIMSAPALVIDANTDLTDAIAVFGQQTVRRLGVVDDGRFVGVISLDDLLVDAAEQLRALTAPLAGEITSPHRDSPVPERR